MSGIIDNGNGNTLKYRVDLIEQCCNDNRNEIDALKFVKDYKLDIMELNIMRERIESINKKLDEKDERDKWFMRLLVGALVTGILTPIIMKLIETG